MKSLARLAIGVLYVMTAQGWAEPAEKQGVLKALDDNHARMVQAFVDQDANAFAACWMPEAVCLAEELPLLQGKDPLCNAFLDAVGGASMHGLEKLDRRLWQSGDFVYETGIYVHRYAFTGREQVQSSAKYYVTVWKKQPDGSWKRAAETWNNQTIPSAEQLEEWRKQTPEDLPFDVLSGQADGTEEGMDAITEQLYGIEKTFHDYFLSDDIEPALAMYSDDARMLSGGRDWCVGKAQIRDMVMNGRKQAKLIGIECDSIASGGDQRLVYIVNRFHWQFTPVGGDGQIYDFYGKGLHIWQKQPDGQWRIVIDINNTNPAPGDTP